MAKRIAPELSALTVERSRLGEQFQDAVRGRPVTAEMHAIVGLNDSLVDLHSRLDSVTAGLAQARTAERRLREALEPFAAIDLTTNQAVDAMDVLRARRALEGGE